MYTFISRQSQLLSLSNGHHQFYFRFRLILLQLDLHTAKELWSARDLAWLPPHLSKTLIHDNKTTTTTHKVGGLSQEQRIQPWKTKIANQHLPAFIGTRGFGVQSLAIGLHNFAIPDGRAKSTAHPNK